MRKTPPKECCQYWKCRKLRGKTVRYCPECGNRLVGAFG